MVMNPVEDPEHLNQRRQMYLLPVMDLYKCEMEAIDHREIPTMWVNDLACRG
jgi:hypothetical protein